jgi:(S)-ureidoglycine aminohydrolase
MQLTANSMGASTEKATLRVPATEEQVISVKTGILHIQMGDSAYALNARSVAVLMPGENFLLTTTQPCSFYLMKYSNRAPMDTERGKKDGGSFVKHWDDLPFKPNTNGGGRRDFFEQGTAMQKRFEMHVTTLKEGMRSHDPHKHRAEEIVLVVEGDTEMQIGEKFYTAAPGGFYYLGSNVSHAIKTTGTKPSTYFAIQFE